MAKSLTAVCSPRSSSPNKGHGKRGQWWKRDVYHIAHSGISTLCGRDRSEWLTIGEIQQIDANCCTRCAGLVLARKL